MTRYVLLLFVLITGCDTGNLKVIMDIPMELNEVSGLAYDEERQLFWMINDSGNKPILYGLDEHGSILKTIKIKAKNRDWEDLTMDTIGNVYIGNFGNNDNDSKGLSILKVSKDSIDANLESIKPEKISFSYPEQKKFPPKKSKRHFDCESFFFYRDSLYLFTKSRAPKERGKTNLYRLPTTAGEYKAEYLSTFNTCEDSGCWVTSADINNNGNKMVLLTENNSYIFTDFKNTKFFEGTYKKFDFDYSSQKESVVFKNDSTLYIADEYLGVEGGNLYEFQLK
ncbi:SdiA-regulated domain-containing protein [Winogradskyella sp. 3972H.M.0a.05]|uniref:SdiA-regulated domain-containing protein n=1 Tax=Winogradskyella sp. 3972H.M.0a.05 TaxID=2950277 RepID=UPI00339B9B46